jgi:hypothetical protein
MIDNTSSRRWRLALNETRLSNILCANEPTTNNSNVNPRLTGNIHFLFLMSNQTA